MVAPKVASRAVWTAHKMVAQKAVMAHWKVEQKADWMVNY
jgi:hypothetical protein